MVKKFSFWFSFSYGVIVFLPKAGFSFFIRVSAKGTEEWYDGFVWKLALQAKASCRSSYRLSLTRIKKCSLGFLFKFQTQGYAGDPEKENIRSFGVGCIRQKQPESACYMF